MLKGSERPALVGLFFTFSLLYFFFPCLWLLMLILIDTEEAQKGGIRFDDVVDRTLGFPWLKDHSSSGDDRLARSFGFLGLVSTWWRLSIKHKLSVA